MTSDDSRRVAARAQTALEAAEDATQAPPPDTPARRQPPAPPQPPAAPPAQAARAPGSRRPIAIGVALAAIAARRDRRDRRAERWRIQGRLRRAIDDGSGVQSTTGAVNASDKIPAGNLVKNPSFEQGLTNWDSNNSTLSTEQAPDAPDGSHVVRVAATDAAADWAVDVSPDTVQDSVGGTHYTATAWVKGTDSSNGTIACLTVRERNGDAQIGRATGRHGVVGRQLQGAARAVRCARKAATGSTSTCSQATPITAPSATRSWPTR